MVVRGFRLQWLAPFLGLAAIFGGCRSSTPVVAGADPSPPSPTSTDPSVWSVDLMTVLPGEHDRYRRFIDANWARARRTARERGQVLSYHALFRPDTAQGNWHVVLPTEYPDSAAYGRREEMFSRESGIGNRFRWRWLSGRPSPSFQARCAPRRQCRAVIRAGSASSA